MYYNQQQRYRGKDLSKLILLFACVGALMFAVGWVMRIVDVADQFANSINIALDCFAQLFILAAGVVFSIYYLACYSKSRGNMLIPATCACVAISGAITILSIIIGVIETSNKGGGNTGDLLIGSLPNLVSPVIIAVFFGIVAFRFVTGKFSMIAFAIAFGFVLANCPQEIVTQFVALIQSTSDDKSPIIFELMRCLGKAGIFTSVLIFGVREAKR